MNTSWSSVHQIVCRRAKKDTKYRRTLEKQGKIFLPDVRGLSDEELISRLSKLGLDLDQAKLSKYAEKFHSAEVLVKDLRAEGVLPDDPELHAWLYIIVLWERWLKDRPCFELLDDWMQQGYVRCEEKDSVGACTLWLDVWKHVIRIADEHHLKKIDDIDKLFYGTQCFFNWVQDLEMELHNAGIDEKRFLEARKTFSEAFLKHFPESDENTIQNTRRALAEANFLLGNRKETERMFEQWLKDDPKWGFGWIGWADCWSMFGDDDDKAKAILERGYSTKGVSDKDDIAERLEYLGVIKKKSDHSSPNEPVRSGKKVGRNQPCPCGSGKKHKKCCL